MRDECEIHPGIKEGKSVSGAGRMWSHWSAPKIVNSNDMRRTDKQWIGIFFKSLLEENN